MNFRDLLKWISGSGKEISEGSVSTAGTTNRRRHLRLELPDATISIGGKGPFQIQNLSFGGVRFSRKVKLKEGEQVFSCNLEDKIHVVVTLASIRFPANIIVKNLSSDSIGCSFVDLTTGNSRILGDFLKPRILAKSVHEISVGSMKEKDSELQMRWFQGDENTQIFIWEGKNGEPAKVEFYFMNYLIKMDQEKRFQTGKKKETTGEIGYGRGDSASVAFFQTPSQKALKIGQAILETASIPKLVKDRMVKRIEQEERRLYQRYFPENDEALFFVCDVPEGKKLAIANLSLQGIAFLHNEELSSTQLPVQGEISGLLNLAGVSLKIVVKLVYQYKQVIGGKMKMEDESATEILAGFLAPRILSQSLEESQPPVEEYPFAPPGARPYLFVGRHNTHILALLAPGGRLVAGRISFREMIICFERGKILVFRSDHGIVFPSEWEIPMESVEQLPDFPEDVKVVCLEILKSSKIPDDVRKAWVNAISGQ
ncbi:MAG: PilZ domain-containing protein [Candidatus Riflebacteria bacterium]|nr:PilZ domain-containing protein [Candidatus Riflebacteria bacterium]